MWGNDFIFMDGFETPSGLWTTNPDPANYIATPWGQGFDGSKIIYKRFYEPITDNEFWFGAHIKPIYLQGLGSHNSIIKFNSDYMYTALNLPIANPMYMDVGLSGSGAIHTDYFASRTLFASAGYKVTATHFEVGQWNHFMVGVRVTPVIIDTVRFVQFETSVYKNNNLVMEDTSEYLAPYNGFAGIYSLLKWDGITLNGSYPGSRFMYDNVWISHNGPKGDLIANN